MDEKTVAGISKGRDNVLRRADFWKNKTDIYGEDDGIEYAEEIDTDQNGM